MTSSINPSLIDPTFPVANKNQSSQGFRTNFAGIQTNFSYAKNEITTLQGTTIVLSGDVTNNGVPPSLNQVSPYQIPLSVSLANILSASTTFDSSKQDASLVVDQKGRISSVTVTDKTAYNGDTSPKITITKNTTDVDYPADTGIASITMPVFTIGEYGIVQSSTMFTVNEFGLLGYSMPKAALMAGSNLNNSKFIPPYTTYSDYDSSKTYVLVSDPNQETGIKWENISTQLSGNITASNGIESTTTNGVIGLSLTTSNITEKTTLVLTDKLFVSNTDSTETINYSSLADLKTFFDGYYIGSLSQDSSPKLSSDLNMNGHGLTSTTNLVITAESVQLGTVQYQIVPPTSNGLFLSFNTDGSTKYVSVDTGGSSVTNGNGLGETTDSSTNVTTLYLDYSNMTSSTVDSYYDAEFTVFSGKNTKLVSLKSMFLTSKIYVDTTNGNDTYDGSFVFPVKTITQALTLGTNIILMPGTYTENIKITSDAISIIGSNDGDCILNGVITISTDINSCYVEGVKFEYTSGVYPISITGSVVNLTLKNCDIEGSQSDRIIDFSTLPTGSNVYFENCYLVGTIQNSYGGNVYVNGYSRSNSGLRVSNTGNGSFYVSNLDVLLSINHTSGNVYISNVTSLYDEYNLSTTTIDNTIVNLSYVLNSTSTNTSNLIVLDNVNLYNFQSNSYSQINQTGTCGLQLNKVLRDVQNDVISGTIISPDFFFEDASRIKYQTVTTDTTLDSDTEWHQLNVTSNSTVSISSPNYSIPPYVVKKKYILMTGNSSCTLNVSSTSGLDNVYVGGSNRCLYTLMWDTISSNWTIIDSSYITSSSNYNKNINNLELGGTGTSKSITANGNTISFETDKITFSSNSVFDGFISETVSSDLKATGTDFDSALAITTQINDVTSIAGSNGVKTYTYPSTLYDSIISIDNTQESTSGSGIDFEANITSETVYLVNNLSTTGYGSGYAVNDALTTNYGNITVTGISDGTDTSISSGTDTLSTSNFTTDPSGYKIASTGGTGSGASFNVTSTSSIMYVPSEITLDVAGSGYAVNDTITLTNTGTVTVETIGSSGEILTISSVLDTTPQNSDMSGTGIVGTSTGSGTGASFNITSTSGTYYSVTGITLNDVGIGYKVNDVLTVGSSYGTYTITELQQLSSGAITSYTFVSTGTEYSSDQTSDSVTITANSGSGTGASFTATNDIRYKISSATITNSGSGYAINDTITLSSGVIFTVTGIAAASSVSLPTVNNGTTITISNRTGSDIYVYPNPTEQIESETIGSSVIVSDGSIVKFIKITDTLWRS